MNRRYVLAAALVALLAVPSVSHAQEAPAGLAGLLLRFFSPTNPVVLQAAPDPFSHAAHFVSQPNAQETLRQLNRGIASQLSTFPLGSSSAGFTYTFDPELGVFNRSTETFGPVFSERPLTAGKGKFSFGATQLHATYDRFEGQDLRAGDIKLFLTHQDVNEDGSHLAPALWFEGDIIEAALSIDLKNDTTVLYANYGVSDRFDIGVAVPYQRLDLTARIDARIEHLATAPDPFVVHTFPDAEGDDASFLESGSAEGVGDVVLRGKYNFHRGAQTNVAAALDLRLPTGDADNLLGSGATQAKLYAIAARVRSKRFSPRIAAGYTFSSGGADFVGDLPDEIDYSAGFDAALHSRATFTADFLGRTLLDADRLVLRERVFENVLRTDPTIHTTTHLSTETTTGNLNVLLGSAGVKVNPAGRLLLMVNLLFAIGDSGLQDKVTPVFGVDYSF
jgi:outer membrane putative beta-barrel porin/alpha-amylase